MKSIGNLFRSPPDPWWGLRGDPFLWKDMARVFRPVDMPESSEALQAMLEASFLVLTSQQINSREAILVQRYAHGGMSSGQIDPDFWREKGFPLIVKRFIAQQSDEVSE
jgi:hypothetical protein